jgi:carbon-monoxide dehydrogenase small subunit
LSIKEQHDVHFTVNGKAETVTVSPRTSLAEAMRESLGLTGTHIGCEHGVCGACTVQVDGRPMRSCLMFAVQAEGASITTIEGIRGQGDALHPIQRAFNECHGLHCGFCTPGMIITLEAFLRENTRPTAADVREAISGNLCMCTGYQNIVRSALRAAELLEGKKQ